MKKQISHKATGKQTIPQTTLNKSEVKSQKSDMGKQKQTPLNPPVNGGKSAADAAAKQKRKPNAAFLAPMLVTPELAAIVGTKPLPRPKITVKVWEYIKANGCQDRTDKRMINPSGLLIPVIGEQPVTMFAMTRLVGKHILGAAE